MKVIFDGTTGRIYRAYADDNFACPLGAGEVATVFDNSIDPSTKRVDVTDPPNYALINQDTFKVTATSGSIIGAQVSSLGTANIVVDETVNFTIQKIDGESTADMADGGDNEHVFISLGDMPGTGLASLSISEGDFTNGVLTFSLTAPSSPGSEELQILGDGLHAVIITLNYVST